MATYLYRIRVEADTLFASEEADPLKVEKEFAQFLCGRHGRDVKDELMDEPIVAVRRCTYADSRERISTPWGTIDDVRTVGELLDDEDSAYAAFCRALGYEDGVEARERYLAARKRLVMKGLITKDEPDE